MDSENEAFGLARVYCITGLAKYLRSEPPKWGSGGFAPRRRDYYTLISQFSEYFITYKLKSWCDIIHEILITITQS